MQAQDFVRKWQAGSPAHELNERAGAQAHFIDLCRVLGVPEPGDPERSDYDLIARFAPRDELSLGRRFVAFSEALESLLGRPVDLMTDHPIDNPYLRQSVEATRRSLHVEPAAQTPA